MRQARALGAAFVSANRQGSRWLGACLPQRKGDYFQSPYYAFFFPLFALSALYELVVRALGLRNLAAYVVVVAERRSD